MDRRTFIKTAILASGVPTISVIAENAKSKSSTSISKADCGNKPNILFILSDQHNAKCMGHQNHPDVKTPHLDRMAAEGVRFDACTTASPVCTPSRVSFISGQYCHNHGYYGLNGPNPRGLPTVMGYFRRAGYRTAAIGKAHCPANWMENDNDVFHDTTTCSVGGQSKEYVAYLAERGLTQLEDHAALNEFGAKGVQTVEGRPSKVSYRDGQEGWVVTKSIEFMQQCKQDKQPFFIHVGLPKPHECYTPAQEFWDLYQQDKLTMPPNTNYDMSLKAPHLRNTARVCRAAQWTLFEPKTFEGGRRRKLHGYLGNISHVDHAVGELFDWIRNSGLDENTIVVYSSDHGDYACEHDIMEKAPGICSDAITRVPFIWRWPKHFKSGHVVKNVVETIDMVPTLCALAGLEPLQTTDGVELSEMLKGHGGDKNRVGLTEFAWSKSLRKGQWRLVYYPRDMFADEYPGGFGELYKVGDDPWEMKNLYFDNTYSCVVAAMEKELCDYLITTTRPTTFIGSDFGEPSGPQVQKIYQHSVNADNKMHYDRIRRVVFSDKLSCLYL